jgi:hypothetical protein
MDVIERAEPLCDESQLFVCLFFQHIMAELSIFVGSSNYLTVVSCRCCCWLQQEYGMAKPLFAGIE